ncbi:hypothetical protein [Xenorhabdus lircayensis]|uniref:Uncharacterized protein n=1 Tax=Xenorhabdus lircayensis TaxID=2763499 RepID=A0ABS0U7J3_9GAMM|nr:hypothetical protein [Xenorhabdus lircayensis]MBI6549853.1 hypothetical protein [Xenorhabdus lircayensis]
MIKITLLLFSGRENYTWNNDSDSHKIDTLLKLFQVGIKGLNMSEHTGKLGFSGFLVEFTDDTEIIANSKGLPKSFYICDGRALNLALSQQLGLELIKYFNLGSEFENKIIEEIYNVEKELYDPSNNVVQYEEQYIEKKNIEKGDKELHDVTSSEIFDTEIISTFSGLSYPIQAGLFKKNFWNTPERIEVNNCYAYACNYASGTFPQPGRYSNKPHEKNIQSIIDGAIADGLVPLDNYKDKEHSPNYVVALYAEPPYPDVFINGLFWDYHWYRLVLGSGERHRRIWGHKLGQMKARKRDNKGKIIRDPCYFDRGIYTEFGGYFIVNNEVKIK